MGHLSKALKASMTGKCARCHGSGKEAFTQAAEISRKGDHVGVTDMTGYHRCRECGGSGRR